MEPNLNWDDWELLNYNSLNRTEQSVIPHDFKSFYNFPEIKTKTTTAATIFTQEPTFITEQPVVSFPPLHELPPLPLSPILSPRPTFQSYVEAFEVLADDPLEDLITFFQPTIIIVSFCITNTLLWLNLPE